MRTEQVYFIFHRKNGHYKGFIERYHTELDTIFDYVLWDHDFEAFHSDYLPSYGNELPDLFRGPFPIDFKSPPLYSHHVFDQIGQRMFALFFFDPEAFLNGATFIDEDQKGIWVYSDRLEYGEGAFRRSVMALAHKMHPGWLIRPLGNLRDLLQQVGYHVEKWTSVSNMSAQSYIEEYGRYGEAFLAYQNKPVDRQAKLRVDFAPSGVIDASVGIDCVVSLSSSGTVKDYVFQNLTDGDFVLGLGPDILDMLKGNYVHDLVVESMGSPQAGLYIDLDKQQLHCWYEPNMLIFFAEELKRLWQGWEVLFHQKGWPYQYALTGRDPQEVMMPVSDVQRLLLQTFSPLRTPGIMQPAFRNWSLKKQSAAHTQLDALISELPAYYPTLWQNGGEIGRQPF